MRHIKSILTAFIIIICVSGIHAGEKKEDIKRLIIMTGALKIGVQFATVLGQQMTEMIKTLQPDIHDSVITIMNEELKILIEETMHEESGFVDMLIEIYAKHYSHKDIKNLIAFYETDTGKKTIEIMPDLLQESMELSQKWGSAMGPVIVDRLRKRMENKGISLPEI